MGEPKKDDEHIEELLSQLQGIFGKLSKAEEEEASQKIDTPSSIPSVPRPAPDPRPAPMPTPPPRMEPLRDDPFALKPPPLSETPTPTPVPPAVSLPPAAPPAMADISPPGVTVSTGDPEPLPSAGEPAPLITPPLEPVVYDNSVLTTAIFYPISRDKEANTLQAKVEALSPKFTKVSFKLKVILMQPYEPKSEWREEALARITQAQARVFFVLTDRAMDDTKRRLVLAKTEPLQIYFQEVVFPSLEKKAFFTDLLLGLVFFFDSLKPKE